MKKVVIINNGNTVTPVAVQDAIKIKLALSANKEVEVKFKYNEWYVYQNGNVLASFNNEGNEC